MKNDEQKALADIESYGCHILHILADDSNPRFSYSIGIEKRTSHPDLIVTGLKEELAHFIINEYNNRIKAGEKFRPNLYYAGFLGQFEITFKKVRKKHYKEYFGWLYWLNGNDKFHVYQLIYPNVLGQWPWDKEAPEDYRFFIPNLYA